MVNGRHFLVHGIDFLLNFFIFAPLVVFYWRGSWMIIDIYLFPDRPELNAWISFGVGHTIMLTARSIQRVMKRLNIKRKFLFFFVSRLWTYIVGFGSVNQWHGAWLLFDFYAGTGWLSALSSFLVGAVSLILSRSYSNVKAPPLLIHNDIDGKRYFPVTRRLCRKFEGKCARTLDAAFTVVVNGTMIVLVWRGLWELLDVALPPEDTLHSGLYTLALGYGLGILLYPMQFAVKHVSDTYVNSFFIKLVLEDTYMVAAGTIPIAIWRGVWLTTDALVLPNDVESSVWLTHGVGFGGLLLMGVCNSVIVRGLFLDGEHDTCFFDIPYVRYFADRKRDYNDNVKCDDNNTTAL